MTPTRAHRVTDYPFTADPECPGVHLRNGMITALRGGAGRNPAAAEGDAWAWGIVIGWQPAELELIALRWRWLKEEVALLERLHTRFVAAFPSCGGTP